MNDTRTLAYATDNEPLINRAMSAWWRAGHRESGVAPPIPANDSYLCELDGRQYVVLHNINGVLAVYRVHNNGQLRLMRRPPRQLLEEDCDAA
jgi:hypothetical protein